MPPFYNTPISSQSTITFSVDDPPSEPTAQPSLCAPTSAPDAEKRVSKKRKLDFDNLESGARTLPQPASAGPRELGSSIDIAAAFRVLDAREMGHRQRVGQRYPRKVSRTGASVRSRPSGTEREGADAQHLSDLPSSLPTPISSTDAYQLSSPPPLWFSLPSASTLSPPRSSALIWAFSFRSAASNLIRKSSSLAPMDSKSFQAFMTYKRRRQEPAKALSLKEAINQAELLLRGAKLVQTVVQHRYYNLEPQPILHSQRLPVGTRPLESVFPTPGRDFPISYLPVFGHLPPPFEDDESRFLEWNREHVRSVVESSRASGFSDLLWEEQSSMGEIVGGEEERGLDGDAASWMV